MTWTLIVLSMVVLPAADTPTAPEGPVRIGGQIKEPRKLKHVHPVYPADARLAGLEGKVVLDCIIDVKGEVSEVRVLEGVPPLAEAAVTMVKKWRYSPVLLNGTPIPVILTVTTNFDDSGPFLGGLLHSLKSKNEFYRESAARWLGRGHPNLSRKDRDEITRELQRLEEQDESERVRTAAAESLLKLERK